MNQQTNQLEINRQPKIETLLRWFERGFHFLKKHKCVILKVVPALGSILLPFLKGHPVLAFAVHLALVLVLIVEQCLKAD